MGRWSAPNASPEHAASESALGAEPTTSVAQELPTETEITAKTVGDKNSAPKESISPSFVRVDDGTKNKQITNLFDLLMEANKKDDIEEQNRLFAEMEALNPKHEKVFQAKATFLQEDDDWDGARKVLEECVTAIPNSVYCLKRLTNIRSSTNDDKIRYGTECLQVAKNHPLCMVDLAIALHSKGQFVRAKDYFEQALSLPSKSEGYDREYILYHYGFTLESLRLYQKAKEVFTEACRLGMKPACEKLKT